MVVKLEFEIFCLSIWWSILIWTSFPSNDLEVNFDLSFVPFNDLEVSFDIGICSHLMT